MSVNPAEPEITAEDIKYLKLGRAEDIIKAHCPDNKCSHCGKVFTIYTGDMSAAIFDVIEMAGHMDCLHGVKITHEEIDYMAKYILEAHHAGNHLVEYPCNNCDGLGYAMLPNRDNNGKLEKWLCDLCEGKGKFSPDRLFPEEDPEGDQEGADI